MHPLTTFNFFNLTFVTSTMTICCLLAFLIFILVVAGGRLKTISRLKLFCISLVSSGAALVGARLGHVFIERPSLLENPMRIIQRLDGMVFYPGLFLFVIVFFGLMKSCKPSPEDGKNVVDRLAMGLLAAYAILRVGCYMAGCCWGRITFVPWAVHFPFHDHSPMGLPGLPVHPVQLYESIAALSIAAGLMVVRRFTFFSTMSLLPAAGFFYAIQRFSTEYFRADSFRGEDIVGHLSTSQVISVLLVLGLILFYLKTFSRSLIYIYTNLKLRGGFL
jgi:phosphatidylglycerol:prolipoprotein diacylglycerol transferase